MMRTTAVRLAILLVLLTSPACASGSASADGPRRSSDTILADELMALESVSVQEAIQRLRPAWLRPRGATSVMAAGDQLPRVILNDVPSDLGILAALRATDVTLLRYIDGRDATTRYGTGYVNGLIEVTTSRGR